MTGAVNARLEATLPLEMLGPRGQQRQVTAVIDTGYNGYLSLPMAIVTALNLPPLAPSEVRLGDGSRKVLNFYQAEIVLDGQRRKVRALCVEGDPLLGTALLRGYRLTADFIDGGTLTVDPRP